MRPRLTKNPPPRSALEGILGKGCARSGQILSLRLEVSTPSPASSPAPERDGEDEVLPQDRAEDAKQHGMTHVHTHSTIIANSWPSMNPPSTCGRAPVPIWSLNGPKSVRSPRSDSGAPGRAIDAFRREDASSEHSALQQFTKFNILKGAQAARGTLSAALRSLDLGSHRQEPGAGAFDFSDWRPWQSSEWTCATSSQSWVTDVATTKNPFVLNMQALKLAPNDLASAPSDASCMRSCSTGRTTCSRNNDGKCAGRGASEQISDDRGPLIMLRSIGRGSHARGGDGRDTLGPVTTSSFQQRDTGGGDTMSYQAGMSGAKSAFWRSVAPDSDMLAALSLT